VYTRVDGVAVQAGGLGDLLTSGEAYRIACTLGRGNWVDRECLLVLAAERRRSLRECAGDILFVFKGLSAGKASGAAACQLVSCAAMRVFEQCLRCFRSGGRHGGGC
jgi:hypothetical protein